MTTDPAVTAACNVSREIRTTETPQSNTSPGIDPAVTAAAEALARRALAPWYEEGKYADFIPDAAAAVAAARPIIEAEVRERIAAEIEASVKPQNAYPLNPDGYIAFQAEANARKDAARLARGQA